MTQAHGQLPDWRRAFGEPLLSGVLKQRPIDFQVTELLDLEFDGAGEHDWLWIEKTGTNTAWLARQLAACAGVALRDVGFAGQKDRHAVTRQWFSVRRPGGSKADWPALELPGVRILEQARHSRKLRRGAHRGNRFDICLHEVRGEACERLRDIAAHGVPNYFGEQRFGHDAANLGLAQSLFAGKRLRREKRSLALSAARSFLFNVILDDRVGTASWNCLLPGDIASLDGSNSVFAVPVIDATLEQRAAELDLHPSGALWGAAGRDAAAVGQCRLPAEVHAVRAHTALCDGLERMTAGARRALRLRVAELAWEQSGDRLRLHFVLPRGAFATAVLREVADYREPAARRSLSSA